MSFNFNPLWKLLIDRNMNKEQLRKGIGYYHRTIAKMGRNEYVSLKTLDDICNFLDCEIDDIVVHVKDNGEIEE